MIAVRRGGRGGGLSLKSYSAKVLPGRKIWWSLQQMMDEPSADSELRFYRCKKKKKKSGDRISGSWT